MILHHKFNITNHYLKGLEIQIKKGYDFYLFKIIFLLYLKRWFKKNGFAERFNFFLLLLGPI